MSKGPAEYQAEGHKAYADGVKPQGNPYKYADRVACTAWIAGYAMARTEQKKLNRAKREAAQ